jgi:hypothetical protein
VLTAEATLAALKISVIAVTVLLACSLTALGFGRYRLHGKINLAFFILVLAALLGFELVAHVVNPGALTDFLRERDKLNVLYIHLGFSVPAALVLPAMLYTGLQRLRRVHVSLGIAFLLLWSGTFITGVFFLPPALP